ncbi:MAG: prepilin-type N-terminal cleavage/methylation domain-containing protein [Candidatus Omnitrophota bacterium]
MKKGFTLIELMIVIIIIGVLATIGIVQYQSAVEKSRGAEAKSVIGYLRGQCAAIWMENSDTAQCTDARLNLGTETGNIPNTAACTPATNFFWYSVPTRTADRAVFLATRCINSGKTPQQAGTGSVNLTVNYTAGTDTWASVGGY